MRDGEEQKKYAASDLTGTVFDIERFSVHDGRGIRTVVFLKGCPLRCKWCSNPESQQVKPQVGLFAEKCVFCLKCADVCPFGEFFKETHTVDWAKCTRCMKCVDECLYGARVLYGETMAVNEVVDIIKKDKVFYKNSNGGVTLSGGEMSAQPKFAAAILKSCQDEGIHTAIETCGFSPWEPFCQILKHTDLLLYDLKHMDSGRHKEGTGVDNALILENAQKASECVEEMIVRFPVIPGFNDTAENVHQMARFIKEKLPRVRRVDMLPYHSTGESKCERIGKVYPFQHDEALSDEHVQQLKEILVNAGIEVSVGG